MSRNEPARTVLIGGLGRKPRQCTYRSSTGQVEASSSLAALVRLGIVTPGQLIVVTTREGWEAGAETLRRELAEAGPVLEPFLVDDHLDRPRDLFDLLGQVVPRNCQVVLELAGGFRHVSLLLYLAALAAEAKGDIELAGTWYVLEGSGERPGEPIDLEALAFLVDWRAALASFRKEGSLFRMKQIVERRKARLFRAGRREEGTALSQLATPLANLADALEMGLPLWVGRFGRKAIDALEARQENELRGLPVKLEELRRVARELSPFALRADEMPPLGREELERELHLAQWYAEHDRPRNALLLLREWMVNMAIDAVAGDPVPGWFPRRDPAEIRESWLEYQPVRNPVANRLSVLAERLKNEKLRENMREAVRRVAAAWAWVTEERNRLAHASFRTDARIDLVADLRKSLSRRIDQELRPLLDAGDAWRLELEGEEGVVVVQPVGYTPGVLATAVTKLDPDVLVVLCSAETRGGAEEVLHRLDAVPETRWVVLEDVFGCHASVEEVLGRDGLGLLLGRAREVRVVLTGGTSAMIALASHLGDYAARCGVTTRRWILVDRRPREEQERDPVVIGEAVPLDAPAEDDGTND